MSEQHGFPDQAFGVASRIELEKGRWVVYLDVTVWDEAGRSSPLQVTRRRIADYSTRSQAEVAAKWMERSTERDLPHPPLGY